MAIEQALTILGWYENLPSDEVPPEYLWEDNEGLEQWWEEVKAKHEDGLPIMPRRGSEDDDEESDEVTQNDLARIFKG